MKITKGVGGVIISLISFLVAMLCIETIFYLRPQLIPKGVLLSMSSRRLARAYGNEPVSIIERLGENPWIKFKPGVTVKRAMRSHEVSTFINEWITDRHGFNNDLSLLDGKTTKTVVLGDSHTEGIGVANNEHFAAILTTEYDTPTLNLGVQGYGPQQLLGVYEKFGRAFSPDFVIFCQNGNTFSRSLLYENGKYTGGISSYIPLGEHKISSNLVTESVFFSGFSNLLSKISAQINMESRREIQEEGQRGVERKSNRFVVPPNDITSRKEFEEYLKGLLSIYSSKGYLDLSDVRVQSDIKKAMEITKKVILHFVKTVRDDGAIPVVFIMPTNRYLVEIVYPELYRDVIKGTFIELEYWANEEMLNFCRKNNILVIDGIKPIREYMNKEFILTRGESVDFKHLPFFKVDGHPSQVAHGIYASSIAASLKRMEEIEIR